MEALWANIPRSVTFPDLNLALASRALLASDTWLPGCSMYGALGWTMRPCHRSPSPREPHFTDAANGYDNPLDDIVITCAVTLGAVTEVGAMEECITAATNHGWAKVLGATIDHIKETIPMTNATDIPLDLLEGAKHKLDHAVDRFHKVNWKAVPEDVIEYVKNKSPTEDQAHEAFANARLELIRQVDLLQNLDWENLPADVKSCILELTERVENYEWKNLPEDVKELIRKNPGTTAITIAQFAVPVLFPELIALIGFNHLGPVAGSWAPSLQSKFGTPFLFRTLQSYGMGGWGVGAINRAFSLGGVAVNGAVVASKFKQPANIENVEEKCMRQQETIFTEPWQQCDPLEAPTEKMT